MGDGMRTFFLTILVATVAVPTHAEVSTATRDAAKNTCKALVKTELVDKKVMPEAIDPVPLCNRLDAVFVPPTAPKLSPTVREITYNNEDKFYDALRQILKKQQGKNLEVWVKFEPATAPTLSSLQNLGSANGYKESGLMTWISKSKGYGNQFCKATTNQSVSGDLVKGGFDVLVSLFDQLIVKWRAATFYNPAKAYSIIAVYSADPVDNQKLVQMRFVPKAFLKTDCGGLLREAKPYDLTDAKELGKP